MYLERDRERNKYRIKNNISNGEKTNIYIYTRFEGTLCAKQTRENTCTNEERIVERATRIVCLKIECLCYQSLASYRSRGKKTVRSFSVGRERKKEKEREKKKRKKKRIRRSTRTFTRAHACASESPLLGKYCSFIGCDVAAITGAGETSIGSSNVSQTLLPATSTSVMGVRLNSHRS